MKISSFFIILIITTSLCVNEEVDNFTIIDGDTIKLDSGDRVRLLGIDTPERGQRCYDEATDKLKELIYGKELTMLNGSNDDRDVYDRLLRYIYVGDVFINLEMVKSGFAYAIDTDDEFFEDFINAEVEARNNNLGCLWSK